MADRKCRHQILQLKNHIQFIYNGGLDPADADRAELRKRRTFSVFILTLTMVGCILLLLNYLLDSAADNPMIVAGLITINFGLYLQAYFNQRLIAANLTILTYWLVVLSLFFNYGIIGTPIFWLFPIAPMAILLMGVRTGWVWCLICILTLIFILFLEVRGILQVENNFRALMNTISDADSGYIFAGDGSIIILVLTFATSFFKTSQASAERQLNETVESLRSEISTRRLAEQKAVDSEKAKTAFLAAMGHELRTPLNGIIGASRIVEKEDCPEERIAFTKVILQSSETLLELINNVLDISSLDSGKVILESRAIHLASFVEQTMSPFIFQSKSKNIEVSYDIAEELPETIIGDPTRLRQIVINLVGNALKFTEQGSVSVRLFREEDFFTIEVKDTGIGIPTSAQAKLFEPYVQADVDTTRKYGGSGLGLAIVKRLSDAMSGKISLVSEPGLGACFSLKLPLQEAKNRTAISDEPRLILPELDILVVDDNAVNRMVLAKLLEKDNHRVVSVTNGLEAVEYAANHSLDLILMDIQMPKMDGFAATQLIRSSVKQNSSIPIIAITANLAETDRSSALNAGMDGFVSKPFRYEELVAVIDRNLGGNAHVQANP